MTEHGESASLTISAALGEIEKARIFIKERLRNVPFQGDDLFHLDLAFFEILVNIVRYGYPDGAGEIRVNLRIESKAVQLEIRDRGIPFDPKAALPPVLDDILSGNKKGGLGIHLAKTFTDEMTYRREGAENVLVLRKVFSK
ncbi:MAG: ATP-binding protein [Candidatus Aminicenantales bacterium]